MARWVREVMNPTLFSVEPDVKMESLLDAVLALGITAVQVLDGDRRPIGVTSLRDLVRGGKNHPIATPALTISTDATIEDAARMMSETGRHHIVVVGGDGRAAGMLSTLDIVRALIGFPAQHPSNFPHMDAALGVVWSNASPFDSEHAVRASSEGGVLVLSTGGVHRTERDLWVESTASVRDRLVELLALPDGEPGLACVLARDDLRFRFASCEDAPRRDSVARHLRERIAWAETPC